MPQQTAYMQMKWSQQDEAMNASMKDLKKKDKVKYLGSLVTFWISKKLNYPAKIESISLQGKMVMIYKNIKEKKISDSIFRVSADYRKISMSMIPSMGKQ